MSEEDSALFQRALERAVRMLLEVKEESREQKERIQTLETRVGTLQELVEEVSLAAQAADELNSYMQSERHMVGMESPITQAEIATRTEDYFSRRR